MSAYTFWIASYQFNVSRNSDYRASLGRWDLPEQPPRLSTWWQQGPVDNNIVRYASVWTTRERALQALRAELPPDTQITGVDK